MRVPVGWLREYCDPGLPAEEIADALTMAGDKLERLHRTGVGDTAAFLTGRVLESERHPNADRLSVCVVDVGRGEPQTIVCGAPNVAAGQTVAVALPGAVMPDGTTLGEAKLRGVASSGMILAEDEVGIGEDHDGIMVLPAELPVGAPLEEHLPIADEVLELEVTPNRPDIMSVYGVARDLHAVTGAPLAEDPTARDAEPSGSDSADDHASVEIDPEICLRFTARVFEDVQIGPSPLWLKQRLMAAGQRPISNVVDITNYVMLATGQPLHAFDLDEVRGSSVIVRRAGGRAHDDAGRRRAQLLLRRRARLRRRGAHRHSRDHGRAGLRGLGHDNARADGGGHLGRAEHHADLEGARPAHRGVGALREATTPRAGDRGAAPRGAAHGRALRRPLRARHDRRLPAPCRAAHRVAARGAHGAPARGADPVERVIEILERLGFERAGGSAGSRRAGEFPPWRDADVQREADLIEEVARIHGLDKLPTTLPAREGAVGRLSRDSACGAGSRTCCATAASTSASPTRSPRPPRSSACASATSRCCGSTTRCPRT